MKICGLGVTESTAIVVGEGKIIIWNLPVGNCVPDVRANAYDSVRTIAFNHPPPFPGRLHSASISPDFNHLVITGGGGKGLDIYGMSTGTHLVGTTTHVYQPWFTRDGREIRHSRGFSGGHKIIRGSEGSGVIGLEPVRDGGGPSGGHLWESSYGYKVTDDGWILDSRNESYGCLIIGGLRLSFGYGMDGFLRCPIVDYQNLLLWGCTSDRTSGQCFRFPLSMICLFSVHHLYSENSSFVRGPAVWSLDSTCRRGGSSHKRDVVGERSGGDL